MKRICTKCGVTKDITEFQQHKQTKDGIHPWCKQCCSEYQKKYQKKNKDKIKKRAEEYRKNNKEKIKKWKKIQRREYRKYKGGG